MSWLDELNSGLSQTRERTRERVTAVADHLGFEVERLTRAHQDAQEHLNATQQLIEQLTQENELLRNRLNII